MKNNLIAAVLVFGFASSAMAAPASSDTGKVTINAHVSSSVSLSFDSMTSGVTGGPANGKLDHTIDFKDVAATTAATSLKTEDVVMRLRSNTPYVLQAVASVTSDGGASGANALGLDDIGFGITDVGNTSANLVDTTTDHTTDATTYKYDPSSADVSTGEVAFTHTLQDLQAAAVDVAQGGRISKGGNVKSDNNYITVTTRYSILPQFFEPTTSDFVAVVNFTLASNP
ncbi:hypothetical protein FGE12_12130 [Aggregicoccus sp. 17bor-14]|uniref:hypothetical protein n=1 Tax=Myxococcaceae TaxID=31 RepID=UPI00129CDAB4|nr:MULTISPECIES: hypothetical protein [Myxococcaceae]MBF5043137.1 hypothetical protein [Simulacricoccus sp. 17bor-14]MRI88897.1 hypothetical protein [Aggregicoccus sp. 17bor-14]